MSTSRIREKYYRIFKSLRRVTGDYLYRIVTLAVTAFVKGRIFINEIVYKAYKEVRKKVHIAAGDELEIFILKKGGIALIPLETEEDKEDIEVIANAIIAYQGTEDTEDKTVESVLDFAREFYRKNK